nr:NAD kinase 2, chloroplastic [Ipomoea batatas]
MATCVAYCPCRHLEMSRAITTAGATRLSHNHPNYFPTRFLGSGFGFCYGSALQRKQRWPRRHRLKLVLTAQLSNAFSVNIGLDSQSRGTSQLRWIGPLPGDIAEVEAYCRIFRAAEQLRNTLMDTLCNPVTGECSVSYDVPSEDKPLLEDKIVSVLGCMVCLLNKGREEVLSGRSRMMNSFRDVDDDMMEDKVPPLAVFRGEMKSYCESLHVALENFLTPDDARSTNVWRKLQRLKNVCYDAGFPRRDDFPCQSLFANWSAVYLSATNEETDSARSEAAFWTGSQVTEEGLKWLLDNGFKTIVDLRAEVVKDNFYENMLDEAICSGKIRLIKLPVEVGTSPSMEQVEMFATLVSDSRIRPIYLHSKEGIRRTSAMVSRWRQFMARYTSQVVQNQGAPSNDNLLRDNREIEVPLFSNPDEGTAFNDNGRSGDDQDESHPKKSSDVVSSTRELVNQSSQDRENQSLNKNEVEKTAAFKSDTAFSGTESVVVSYTKINPLESQLPPPNVFSRKEMSTYFKNRKVSPEIYFTHEQKRLEILCASKYDNKRKPWRSDITSSRTEYKLIESDSPNGLYNSKSLSGSLSASPADLGTYVGPNGSMAPALNGYSNGFTYTMSPNGEFANTRGELERNAISSTIITDQTSNVEAPASSSDEELEIDGDMCASATGVVRVQSRKKAEMFLVRTDGFSCTREKVTESSLAFTHPSTQQQMLMWKSTPKTVLLLKKLGQELMEQAKEVASFMHYQENMNVLVEPEVHDIFARIPGFGFVQTFYSQDTSGLHERVDLVACLGGDGVILHASNIFRGAVPPVVSFNLGSLGFLTSHRFDDYKKDLRHIIHGNNTSDGVYITLRMRLRCEIFRNGKAMPGKVFDVLNEVVVDRGSNPYLSKIECYEHDRLITKVQGDGVIIATPTGSTAYSTAAGGSMVHPNVPCMLFTPICPHSLSFRPVILPDSAKLELKIPVDARSNAWVSFDGKRRQQLSRGDSVRICMSQHPLPTVNKSDQTGDWFHSLIRCLNWNERMDQKAL